MRSQLTSKQREIEELQRKQAEDDWNCWAIRQDGTKYLLATAPTQKECEERVVRMQLDPDTRIEYRQDSETYVLEYKLDEAREATAHWFAHYEALKQQLATVSEKPNYDALGAAALASLKLGSQAPGYRAAKKAIAQFVELLQNERQNENV